MLADEFGCLQLPGRAAEGERGVMSGLNYIASVMASIEFYKSQHRGHAPERVFLNGATEKAIGNQDWVLSHKCGKPTKLCGVQCESFNDGNDTPEYYLAERGAVFGERGFNDVRMDEH